ncbi:MAG: hypothetical protein CM1200mP3_14300 [Chloroflexota bacterium]|nr:MAG: hypothetical protein CM1200mP3_14300 [Chloroflexota bacterium]
MNVGISTPLPAYKVPASLIASKAEHLALTLYGTQNIQSLSR